MRKIRKTNTKPELIARRYLFRRGLRFRIHSKELPGHPDIVLPKYRMVVFVNGCFWHAHHNCKLNRMPKTNTDYWIPKILRNVERDKTNAEQLDKLGWQTLTVWECELRGKNSEAVLSNLYKTITSLLK